MKLAVVGSRGLNVNLSNYIPPNVVEIVSGGANGIDEIAQKYASEMGVKLTVFLPEYSKFRRNAPLVRNRQIVDYADEIYAFWDGKSKGTKFAIDYAILKEKTVKIHFIKSC